MCTAEAAIMTQRGRHIGWAGLTAVAAAVVLPMVTVSCGGDDTAAFDSSATTSAEPTATAVPSPESTATPDSPAPTATPVPTATPSPPAGLPIEGWQRAELSLRMSNADELVAVDGTFVASGYVTGSGGAQQGLWRSDDGVQWDQSLVFARRRPEDTLVVVQALALDDAGELAAIAQRSDGPWPQAEQRELVAFRSTDGGVSWTETVMSTWGRPSYRELEPVGFGTGDAGVVFTVDTGLVEGAPPQAASEVPGTTIHLAEPDGTWERIEPAASGLARARILALSVAEDGYVALGDTVEGDCATQMMWRSADARTWTTVWEHAEACRWYEVDQFFDLDGELWAIGGDPDQTACDLSTGECEPFESKVRLWRVDGDTLVEVDLAPVEFADMRLWDLTLTDAGLIAVGVVVGDVWDLTDDQVRIWTSSDARHWYLADIPTEELARATITQVAANDSRIVALANEVTDFGYTNAHAWVHPFIDRLD